jgi:hypothetical protein
VQPDSTNGYSIDDKVIHKEKFWISTMDNNVWEPDQVNSPWQEYITNWENGVAYALNQKVFYDNVTYISLVENNINVPVEGAYWKVFIEETGSEDIDGPGVEDLTPGDGIVPEWVSAENGGLYMIGDRVIYNGEIYESLIDNNVWSPVDYPAGWSKIEE